MPTRRNFVIGVGSVLTGSSTFFGSGAFDLSSSGSSDNWIPIESRTQSSEGIDYSEGVDDEELDGNDGDSDDSGDDDGTGGGDDDGGDDDTGVDDDGDDTGEDDTDDDTGDGDDAGQDGDDEPEDDDDEDDDDDSSGPQGTNSLLLKASGSEVLDSPHVQTDGNGNLAGLDLENINQRALTYIGETSDGRFPNPSAGDLVAFVVENDGDATVDLSVEVAGEAPEVLNFPAFVDAPEVPGSNQRDLTSTTVKNLKPGRRALVVIEVDTTTVEEVPENAVQGITFVGDPS